MDDDIIMPWVFKHLVIKLWHLEKFPDPFFVGLIHGVPLPVAIMDADTMARLVGLLEDGDQILACISPCLIN